MFPYLSGRKGSSNLYYKRMVPLELRGAGRPAQIWRSLKTASAQNGPTRPHTPRSNCCLPSGLRAPRADDAKAARAEDIPLALTDAEWTILAPLLPAEPPQAEALDNRAVLDKVIWVIAKGRRWTALDAAHEAVRRKFGRWARATGIWQQLSAGAEAAGALHPAAALSPAAHRPAGRDPRRQAPAVGRLTVRPPARATRFCDHLHRTSAGMQPFAKAALLGGRTAYYPTSRMRE